MGTTDDTGTTESGTVAPFRLWLSNSEACEALSIGPRALRKRVAAGKIERRKVGRECRYRILPADNTGTIPEPEKAERRNHSGTVYRHSGTNAVPKAEPTPEPEPEPSPELAALARLVDQLTGDLVRSERDRGEAVGIGHAIADERDRLRAELDALRVELLELAGTSRAWPLRRRLLAAVKPPTVH